MTRTISVWIAALPAAMLAGCQWPEFSGAFPAPRPLGADLATGWSQPAGASTRPAAAPKPLEAPQGPLTLRGAVALALRGSPELAGFAWSVRQAEAEKLQAGLLPNPELETEFENFAGSGEFRGMRALETTISLSQLIELGGKRRKRLALAGAETRLAGWDYEAKRLEVVTRVAQRFVEALGVQRKIELAREDLRLARATLEAVEKRIAAGKSPPTEKSRAVIESATGRIRLGRLERQWTAARQHLSATWGDKAPRFTAVRGRLDELGAVPAIGALAAALGQNPALARWDAELQRRRAALDLARAEGVPDVTVGAGYRHARETDDNDHALLVTASIPLPVFHRNQGRIRKASLAVRRLATDRRAAEVAVHAKLVEAHQKLTAAHDEARALGDEVLPVAERSFQASEKSYRAGKASYLDVLDAQRTLIAAREQYVEALTSCHLATAEVEGIVCESLGSLAGAEPEGKDRHHEKD